MIQPLNEDEQQLIIRIRKGGLKALGELHERYYISLLFLARTLVPTREDAEDVVDGLFMSLLNRRETMDITKSVKGYLIKSVKKRCSTFNSKAKRAKEVLEMYRLTITDLVPATSRMEDAENQQELSYAINSLPPQLKMAIELRFLMEMKRKEIAAIMGVSNQTVTKYVSEALKRLAKYYSHNKML